MYKIEILLEELRELRAMVAELNEKTDKVINEVSGLTLRAENIKVEKLDISGLELELKFVNNTGGKDNECK